MRISSLAPLALAVALALPASAQITASTDAPVVGQPLTLTFGEPADTLTVTYRPGSVASTDDVIVLGGVTSTEWTPEAAGVVQVAVGEASQSLSVRYENAPASGLLVMVLAGLVLFGGAAFAMRSMMGGSTSEGHTFPMDT
ncbi:MAG: hypothetical protein AAFQ43_12095 [Bacteroidota bacterium]